MRGMISKKRWEELKEKEKLLKKATSILKIEEKDLSRVIDRFLKELNEM